MVIVTIAFSIVLVAISSRYVTREEDKISLHYSNTTLILFNGRDYALQSLNVTQDSNHPGNFDHDITIYKHETDCKDLPIQNKTRTVKKNKLTPIYALAGSNIMFTICGSTNLSRAVERLELALIYGLESLQYPPLLRDYLNFSYVVPGSNGLWNCKNVTFPLMMDGYYTTTFLTEPRSAEFNYSLTYFHRYFDIRHFVPVKNYTLQADTDYKIFPEKPYKYCYVATIHGSPGVTTQYVHIRLTYKYYTMKFFSDNYNTMIVFPLILAMTIIVVEIIVLALIKLRVLRCIDRT